MADPSWLKSLKKEAKEKGGRSPLDQRPKPYDQDEPGEPYTPSGSLQPKL